MREKSTALWSNMQYLLHSPIGNAVFFHAENAAIEKVDKAQIESYNISIVWKNLRVREIVPITVILSSSHIQKFKNRRFVKVPVLFFYIYKKTTNVKKGKLYAKQKEQLQ